VEKNSVEIIQGHRLPVWGRISGLLSIQLVTLVEGVEVALDGEAAVDHWVFGAHVRLVEIIDMLKNNLMKYIFANCIKTLH
jgi:hypothetical protein